MTFVELTCLACFGILAVALVLAAVRAFRGPSLADRVVALDLAAVVFVALAAVLCVSSGDAVFLDAATVVALVAFLGTVAFARYLERTS